MLRYIKSENLLNKNEFIVISNHHVLVLFIISQLLVSITQEEVIVSPVFV